MAASGVGWVTSGARECAGRLRRVLPVKEERREGGERAWRYTREPLAPRVRAAAFAAVLEAHYSPSSTSLALQGSHGETA